MTTQNIRQRHGIRRYETVQRLGQSKAAEREWAASPKPKLVPVPAPTPSFSDRVATYWWHLHDHGMPVVWALAGFVVVLAALGITAALIASAAGWQP